MPASVRARTPTSSSSSNCCFDHQMFSDPRPVRGFLIQGNESNRSDRRSSHGFAFARRNRLRLSKSMESARGCGTSQNNFNMAPLPRGLWLVSELPAPTNDHPVSLHPGLCARTCMAQPNRSLEAAGETFLKRFPAQAPSPAFTTARYGHDDGHQPLPVHDRLAQHSGGGGLRIMTCVFGAGKNGDEFFWMASRCPSCLCLSQASSHRASAR